MSRRRTAASLAALLGAGVALGMCALRAPSPAPWSPASVGAPEVARSSPDRAGAPAAVGDAALGRAPDAERSVPQEERRTDPRSAALARTTPAPTPDALERQLEQELAWTEEALDASRAVAEESARAGGDVPMPGSDASPQARALAGSRVAACGGSGATCSSSADCCAGLACAGGVPGFATRGRCEAPR